MRRKQDRLQRSSATAEGMNDDLELRRKRNREAQHVFRIRKVAAQASQQKRLSQLESTIEQMTATFLSFTDDVLHAPGTKQDPHLMSKLHAATNHAILLVRNLDAPLPSFENNETVDGGSASLNDLTENGDVSPHITTDLESANRVLKDVKAGDRTDIDHISPSISSKRRSLYITALEDPSTYGSSVANDAAVITPPYNDPSITPDSSSWDSNTLPTISNVYGDGWISAPPNVIKRRHLDSTSSRYLPSADTLSFMITRASLQNAYYVLLSTSDMGAAVIQRIFKLPVRFLSREEILAGLRWYLRPGSQDIPQLASAPFDNPTEVYFDNTAHSIRTPSDQSYFRMAQSQPNSSAISPGPKFMNAHSIENYLWANGMKYLNEDTMELLMDPNQNRLELDDVGDYSDVRSSKSIPDPVKHFLDFNAFFPIDRATTHSSTSAATPIQKVHLSRSRLMQSLISCSRCLARGPAFSREDVRRAITASIIAS